MSNYDQHTPACNTGEASWSIPGYWDEPRHPALRSTYRSEAVRLLEQAAKLRRECVDERRAWWHRNVIEKVRAKLDSAEFWNPIP